MAYPDSLLNEDERVVRHLHPHWITLVVPVLAFLVTVGLASFLVAIAPSGDVQRPLRIGILAVAVIVLLWFVLVPVLRWRTTHYVITTHRVLIRVGILNHRSKDIPLRRLNDVQSVQTLADRIIGAGTLTLESAGEHGQERLVNVPHADQTQALINRLVEDDADRRSGGEQYRAPVRDDGYEGY